MKRIAALLLLTLIWTTAWSQSSNSLSQAQPSPAERSIAKVRKLIDKNPNDFEAYNALALALSRRARESSDPRFYVQGAEALQKSFSISPDNFDGKRIQTWLLLGKHEFAAALETAQKLSKAMPDDVMTYGFLTDANIELGNYDEAEKAAQWMLDLKPGNMPGFTRAAYLRELFGDIDGAMDLMKMAYESTPPSEVEDRAWILTQMAHLDLLVGKLEESEKLAQQALRLFPGYHYALGNLAKVRSEQKRYTEAVELLQQRFQGAPHAENLFELAQALQLAGQTTEANRAFAEFEEKSLQETNRADNSNHELIFYYADYAHQPAKALEVAQREFARRHDVFTLDAYAWALYANEQFAEAHKQIETALAVGIRDAKFLHHAAEIAMKCGDRATAQRYLRDSAQLNAAGPEQGEAALTVLGQNSDAGAAH
jgi:tetratricopeptide (TPR) repeat protein